MQTQYKNLLKKDNPDKPLTVEVKDKVLTISIGVSVLAFQVDEATLYPFIGEDMKPKWLVNNNDGFAVDVQNELEREEEDGTTPLNELLDKVILKAIESGSIFVDDAPKKQLKVRGSTCPKCDGFVPGHATGAGDICTCNPITVQKK